MAAVVTVDVVTVDVVTVVLSSNFMSRNSFSLSAQVLLIMAYLNYGYLNYAASSWKDSLEDSESRSPLRRPWCLQSETQDKERRQSRRMSGFQVDGAPEFLPSAPCGV